MKLRKTDYIKWFYYFFCSFIYLPPQIIFLDPRMALVKNFINIISIVLTFLIISLYIVQKKHISKKNLMVLLFFLWFFFSNLFMDFWGNSSYIRTIFPTLGYLFLMNDVVRGIDYHIFIKSTYIYCFLICALNLTSQIYYGSEGIYHNWLVSWQPYYICGNGNYFVFFYLYSFFITIQYELIGGYENKKRSIIILVIMLFSMLLADSSTGLISVIFALVVRFFGHKNIVEFLRKHIKGLVSVFLIIVIWFIVFKGWNNVFILNFANDVLGENSSFLERGLIWENAINTVINSPLFGYGTNAVEIARDFSGNLRSAHNNYIQIAVYGGIIALLFYIGILVSFFKSVAKNKNQMFAFSGLIIIIYCIAYLFEQNPFYIGFYAIIFFVNSKFDNEATLTLK